MVLGYGGGLAKGKPHLDASSRRIRPDRQEMLFVGDSLHDGEIAEREGVPFVGAGDDVFARAVRARASRTSRSLRRFAALPELFQ